MGWKCKNNSTCQSGFTQKGYRCSCTTEFEGEYCEKGNYVTPNIPFDHVNYHLEKTSLSIKHSAVEISISTCTCQDWKSHISQFRGTQRIVSVNYLFGRPLIPSDFLERIGTSNFRDMRNFMSVVFGLLKMSFWVPKKGQLSFSERR